MSYIYQKISWRGYAGFTHPSTCPRKITAILGMGVNPVTADDFNYTDEIDFSKILKNPILDIAARL